MRHFTLRFTILIILLLCGSGRVWTQDLGAASDTVTTVLFKNGASVTGTLVSFVPNQTLVLRLTDGRVMTYQASDIERVTRSLASELPPPRKRIQTSFEVFGGINTSYPPVYFAGFRTGVVLPDNVYFGAVVSPSIGFTNIGYFGLEFGSVAVETPVILKPYITLGLGFFQAQNLSDQICLLPGVALAAPVINVLRVGVDVRYLFVPLNSRYKADPAFLFGCLTLGVQW